MVCIYYVCTRVVYINLSVNYIGCCALSWVTANGQISSLPFATAPNTLYCSPIPQGSMSLLAPSSIAFFLSREEAERIRAAALISMPMHVRKLRWEIGPCVETVHLE